MLFKEVENAANEEIREYIPVSGNLAFSSMQPHIVAAERDYIRPLIGSATLTALDNYYNNEGSGEVDNPAIWDGLVSRCQRAVINIAFFIGFDLLNIVIDDAGFGRTESDSRKSLYKYQEDNLRVMFKLNAFNGFDDILTYLHENISTFNDYASSDEYANFKTLFFRRTEDFDKVYNIGKSHLTFNRLKQYIRLTEDLELSKVFGPTLWAYIKTEIAKATPAAKVTALVPYIKNVLAYLSTAKLMSDTGADLTENGLYFTAWKAIEKSQSEISPSDRERVEKLISRNEMIGNNYMAAMKLYLSSNVTDWPTFENSSSYLHGRDNADKKTFWV
jgi:hypothetical protein